MKTSNGSVRVRATAEQDGGKPRSKPGADSEQALFSNRDPDSRALLNALTKLKSGDYSVRLPLHWGGAARKVADAFNEIVLTDQATATEVAQLRQAAVDTKALLVALDAFEGGDFSVRLPLDWEGTAGKVADRFNRVVALNERMAKELSRLRHLVGREGRIHQHASLGEVGGKWAESVDLINDLIADLVQPTSEMARVIGSVATGDLSQTMSLEIDGRALQGEFLRTARTVNTMVNQLSSFASEVTRVAREVGTDGKLGGQANVRGVAGTWKDLTDNVNLMASNLTSQVRNIAAVTTAVANGDLAKKITVDVKGEFLELKDTINTMVDQLRSFASEVTRVAREVGTEGRLGGQAKVEGVSGTWKDLTDGVNLMASNLTGQMRNIAAVTTAVANGDLSKKITVDVRGEILELKNTINTMVDQLNSFASEVTRVAREVGTEGKLGGQAYVHGVAGTWKDLTDSVNFMAGNLTAQVRNIAEVTTAVAKGDLAKKITVDVKGEILELKNTINTMVDQLGSFASEVTRVAREVGTEGKLGGQAKVEGVSGTWKDLTDNVNLMGGNLTAQVRNIAEVTTAVAKGDLSKKITVQVRGEILELKDTINTMVDQLSSFASEVTRVAREVGTEGKLGGQADVRGVAGTWKDLTDSVNSMAGNLTAQVRNIAEVTTAVAKGDLSKKIAVDVKGEILELKNTINTMVDQLSSFASEVTRVAREVGTEGKLGGQAQVRGVAGTWKDLTDNVNFMASNLTGQVRNIAEVTTAVAKGDLSRKITVDVRGEILELKNTINTMVDQLGSFASEVTRVAREVGSEGRLGGQANVRGVSGTWKDLTDSVNFMAGNLTNQVRNIAAVTTAVATGDLSKKITVDVKGEILELKNTINTMVDQLNSFASEVTRVAREVGTEGKLGGQAKVEGVSGTWRDLTDSVNFMASNLTNQVRGIAKVVTAVAQGDLKRKLLVEAKGEIAELADTINNMIDTLATFAEQVTTVAREVGTEGKLGGQSHVPGASGTWRDLNSNVNQLAATLTIQLRAISDVATAVTKGDLTRSITVEAQGEVAQLKDTINEMIRNLRDTTLKNSEQDWLKTNLANFTRMLQGQRDLMAVGRMILSELASVVGAQQGVFYLVQHGAGAGSDEDNVKVKLLAGYAHRDESGDKAELSPGETLVGQAVREKQRILLTDIPERCATISSGLIQAAPNNVIILPVVFENQVKAVIELASFQRFNPTHQTFLSQLTESIGIVLNTIEANSLTEDLLKQSQSLTNELQSRQLELQKTNLELEEKARQLFEQNAEVERKNQEVEQARQALEEKAEQLATTSRFKSEFLANMSHELRTPLNSLLILSDQLGLNPDGNLTARQVEFAKTIQGSGKDLLRLINDILDLSKIESGTVTLDLSPMILREVCRSVERTFRPVAQNKNLSFNIDMQPGLPVALHTDNQRLEQVLKNLLSNAFKFTERGGVVLKVMPATSGWSPNHPTLGVASDVIAFQVIDTGIGIPLEKHGIVFEAFQQADGSTSRRYGGTGLGLAISREIARLLGGEITLNSVVGQGSTFTIYLPVHLAAREPDSNYQIESREESLPLPGEYTPTLLAGDAVPISEMTAATADDRYNIQPGDHICLMAEDESEFGALVCEVVRGLGMKCVLAPDGFSALSLVREFQPDMILLDIGLPHLDGWRLLDRLKSDLGNRHIPVAAVSATGEAQRGLRLGCRRYCIKPVSRQEVEEVVEDLRRFIDRPIKKVLVLEDDPAQQVAIAELIGNPKVQITTATDAEQALELMALAHTAAQEFDCLLLDLRLPGRISGNQLLEEICREPRYRDLATIVYTGKVLSAEEETRLNQLARSIVLKDVRSPERLLDQVTLRLHTHIVDLSDYQLGLLKSLHSDQALLSGRKALLVDDDIRNLFAMTSVLERYGMLVIPSESGPDALAKLEAAPDVDIALMDIMLPEMDGYKVTQAIRSQERYKSLPIVALTAKAMKGDREKCLEAGCSDYLSKPVDVEQLLSVLRLWLHR
ncbi:MAG: HAMP domain-containing protein [Verrucomicrobia bacterium]|nr:HAMP domain-containing protein [Verrucomicrobiota bacterium]